MIAGIHILKNPKGTFHFVGRVPTELAFISSSDDYVKTAILCGPGFAREKAELEGGTFKTRTFQTETEARDFAASKGFEVIG
jgi:hypothetical protein